MRSPKVLLIAIVTAGIVGGVVVYTAGSRIAAQDRETVLTWEARAVQRLRGPMAALRELDALAALLPERRQRAHARAEAALETFARARTTERIPRSVISPVEAMLRVVLAHGIEALEIVSEAARGRHELTGAERARMRAAAREARVAYERLREGVIALRCRARLPACERTLLPA